MIRELVKAVAIGGGLTLAFIFLRAGYLILRAPSSKRRTHD